MALGTAEVNMGAYKKAVNTYLKVARIEPRNSTALHNLAALYRHLGDAAGVERYTKLEREALAVSTGSSPRP